MPEVGDHYTWAEVFLPRGDQMARGHVVASDRDTKGKVMGRSNTNPIFDLRMFKIKFIWGKVIELTAKIIVESMYAQYNSEGNEYLLLEALINYQKDIKKIPLSDQQSTVQGRPVTHKTTAGW